MEFEDSWGAFHRPRGPFASVDKLLYRAELLRSENQRNIQKLSQLSRAKASLAFQARCDPSLREAQLKSILLDLHGRFAAAEIQLKEVNRAIDPERLELLVKQVGTRRNRVATLRLAANRRGSEDEAVERKLRGKLTRAKRWVNALRAEGRRERKDALREELKELKKEEKELEERFKKLEEKFAMLYASGRREKSEPKGYRKDSCKEASFVEESLKKEMMKKKRNKCEPLKKENYEEEYHRQENTKEEIPNSQPPDKATYKEGNVSGDSLTKEMVRKKRYRCEPIKKETYKEESNKKDNPKGDTLYPKTYKDQPLRKELFKEEKISLVHKPRTVSEEGLIKSNALNQADEPRKAEKAKNLSCRVFFLSLKMKARVYFQELRRRVEIICQEEAAIKLQAAVRGWLVRKKGKKVIKSERKTRKIRGKTKGSSIGNREVYKENGYDEEEEEYDEGEYPEGRYEDDYKEDYEDQYEEEKAEEEEEEKEEERDPNLPESVCSVDLSSNRRRLLDEHRDYEKSISSGRLVEFVAKPRKSVTVSQPVIQGHSSPKLVQEKRNSKEVEDPKQETSYHQKNFDEFDEDDGYQSLGTPKLEMVDLTVQNSQTNQIQKDIVEDNNEDEDINGDNKKGKDNDHFENNSEDIFEDKYENKYEDKFEEKYEEKNEDKYKDKNEQKYEEKYEDNYENKYENKYEGKLENKSRDEYVDQYENKFENNYEDKFEGKFADKSKYKYEDKIEDNYENKYEDKFENKYEENFDMDNKQKDQREENFQHSNNNQEETKPDNAKVKYESYGKDEDFDDFYDEDVKEESPEVKLQELKNEHHQQDKVEYVKFDEVKKDDSEEEEEKLQPFKNSSLLEYKNDKDDIFEVQKDLKKKEKSLDGLKPELKYNNEKLFEAQQNLIQEEEDDEDKKEEYVENSKVEKNTEEKNLEGKKIAKESSQEDEDYDEISLESLKENVKKPSLPADEDYGYSLRQLDERALDFASKNERLSKEVDRSSGQRLLDQASKDVSIFAQAESKKKNLGSDEFDELPELQDEETPVQKEEPKPEAEHFSSKAFEDDFEDAQLESQPQLPQPQSTSLTPSQPLSLDKAPPPLPQSPPLSTSLPSPYPTPLYSSFPSPYIAPLTLQANSPYSVPTPPQVNPPYTVPLTSQDPLPYQVPISSLIPLSTPIPSPNKAPLSSVIPSSSPVHSPYQIPLSSTFAPPASPSQFTGTFGQSTFPDPIIPSSRSKINRGYLLPKITDSPLSDSGRLFQSASRHNQPISVQIPQELPAPPKLFSPEFDLATSRLQLAPEIIHRSSEISLDRSISELSSNRGNLSVRVRRLENYPDVPMTLILQLDGKERRRTELRPNAIASLQITNEKNLFLVVEVSELKLPIDQLRLDGFTNLSRYQIEQHANFDLEDTTVSFTYMLVWAKETSP